MLLTKSIENSCRSSGVFAFEPALKIELQPFLPDAVENLVVEERNHLLCRPRLLRAFSIFHSVSDVGPELRMRGVTQLRPE